VTGLAVEAPAPEFTVSGVEADPGAATPALRFAIDVTDPSGREIYTIAITAQVQIDGDRRAYDVETRNRLHDLFGEPEQIPQTAGPLQLGRVEALVPSFHGAGSFELTVPFSGDVELATTRYLASLDGGTVPLSFHFNGSIFYCGEGDRLQVTLVPWSCEARYRMPLARWRGLIDERYAAGGFVRLHAATIEALRRRRTDQGFATFDETIRAAIE
jgi:hypothetical protein